MRPSTSSEYDLRVCKLIDMRMGYVWVCGMAASEPSPAVRGVDRTDAYGARGALYLTVCSVMLENIYVLQADASWNLDGRITAPRNISHFNVILDRTRKTPVQHARTDVRRRLTYNTVHTLSRHGSRVTGGWWRRCCCTSSADFGSTMLPVAHCPIQLAVYPLRLVAEGRLAAAHAK